MYYTINNMVRPTYSEVKQAHRAVARCRARGWPEPDSPYDKVVTEEIEGCQQSHIGATPGVLLDMESVKARQRRSEMPEETAALRNCLHIARQTIVADRVARGELIATAIMPPDAIMSTFEVAPERTAAQIERLVQASHSGWDIRIADSIHFARHLAPNSYGTILIGDPGTPEAVYWQAADDSVPHETWSTAPAETKAAADAYAHLAASALDGFVSEDLLRNLQFHFGASAA